MRKHNNIKLIRRLSINTYIVNIYWARTPISKVFDNVLYTFFIPLVRDKIIDMNKSAESVILIYMLYIYIYIYIYNLTKTYLQLPDLTPKPTKQVILLSLIRSFLEYGAVPLSYHTNNTTGRKLKRCSVELQCSLTEGMKDTQVFLR